ncbi:hypothetical protein EDC01DRAFT_616084 [Geopyxis carbonaria]|nr:hypothetical protein EDC01DRAFT_616084 [Geopyxis carbonaria]
MAPCKPKSVIAGQNPVLVFDGAVSVKILPTPPGRCVLLEATFYPQHPLLKKHASKKPPLHFHPYQREFISVLKGHLTIEVRGLPDFHLDPTTSELPILPSYHHRLFPDPSFSDQEEVVMLLSATLEDPPLTRSLDLVFFQNWYGYQNDALVHGVPIDFVQVLQMFDAGDSYLSLPPWVPFGRTVSVLLGVLVGRWLGGILGYRPFHKEWTTEWDLAKEKMRNTPFQKPLEE